LTYVKRTEAPRQQARCAHDERAPLRMTACRALFIGLTGAADRRGVRGGLGLCVFAGWTLPASLPVRRMAIGEVQVIRLPVIARTGLTQINTRHFLR
jgi:hypothetical protein